MTTEISSAQIVTDNKEVLINSLNKIYLLEKQVEQYKADAERYRWLRDAPHGNRVPHIGQYPFCATLNEREYPHYLKVGLDAAIDAAMKGQP